MKRIFLFFFLSVLISKKSFDNHCKIHSLGEKKFNIYKLITTALIKKIFPRFIDVPMESYGQVLPLRVAVQHGEPNILLVMLRYGASTDEDNLAPAPIEILLSRLNEFEDDAPFPKDLLACLKILLRTIPNVYVQVPPHLVASCGIQHIPVYEQYPNLAERDLLPPERSGAQPPELRHLARCRIRQCLFQNWALPHGIRRLQLPKSLEDYLDLLTD